ncbi:20422_t:CDS:2, partial [Entrophospora sp. SA101]
NFWKDISKPSARKLRVNAIQVTNFFDKKTSNVRRKLCHGLNNERTKIHFSHVAGITSYGCAPPVEDNKLNEIERRKLLDELKSRANWIND